ESVFLEYYHCVGKSPAVILKTQKLKIEKGFIGGVSLTTISFSAENENKSLTQTNFSSSTKPSLGFFMDIVLPRSQEKWSIYNEILFNSYQSSGGYTDFAHEDKYTDYEIAIGASYLSMSNMIRYRLPLKGFKMIFNVGLSNGLLISNTNSEKSTLHFFGTERVKEGLALESLRGFETGIAAGIGLSHNKLSMEIRGVWGNGLSPYSGLKSTATRFLFQLAYRLN
ncbi:MAG: outer membrane beta-barrel protein, partial [Bacteroidales bacterium]|nr:outer membrane beta-barrel protein [Bacteroidales bacterium]